MSRKVARILLTGLLVVMVAVMAAGCKIGKRGDTPPVTNPEAPTSSSQEQTTTAAKSDSLEGVYQGEVDMTEMIGAQSGVDIQTKLIMHFELTINPDETYSMDADSARFVNDTIEYYKAEMPELVRKTIIEEGIAEDQLDGVVQEQGYQDFNEFTNQLIDGMIEELQTQMSELDAKVSTGTYTVTDSSILFAEESGDKSLSPNGQINSNGTISVYFKVDGEEKEVVFKK